MRFSKLLLILGISTFMSMPLTAQDDVYITPSKAREMRKKELQQQEFERVRRQERIREIEAQQRAEYQAIQNEEEYINNVEDWYNRRDKGISLDQMQKNNSNFDGSNKRKTLGKYGKRIRRFSNNPDVIVLKGANKIYVIDDYDYYDPWTSSYYARDWDNGVNIIFNYGPSWGYGLSYRYYGWPYYSSSWYYPWYDSWYNPWYRYDPWYYGSWSWYPYSRYYGPYYGGYYEGFYAGWLYGQYDNYYNTPYSQYGRSSGNYGVARIGSNNTPAYNRTTSRHDEIYGRALGSTTYRNNGVYRRTNDSRSISEYSNRNNPTNTSRRYEGTTNRSNSIYNRSGSTTTRQRNYENINTRTNNRSSYERSTQRNTRQSSVGTRSSSTSSRSSGTTSRSSNTNRRTR